MKKKTNHKANTKSTSPSSGLEDPIAILMDEHDQALKLIEQLRAATQLIKREGFSLKAYTEISEVIQFINTQMRSHDVKEEDILFPLMERHTSEFSRVLRYEHRELWSAMNQLTHIVNDIANSNIHGTSISELVHTSQFVIDHLTSHIEKENTRLFPMVKQLLSPPEYDQFRMAMNAACQRERTEQTQTRRSKR